MTLATHRTTPEYVKPQIETPILLGKHQDSIQGCKHGHSTDGRNCYSQSESRQRMNPYTSAAHDAHSIFRLDGLRDFLEYAQSRTRLMSFSEWDGEPGILLRHDVDYELGPAGRVAELESEIGVRSTFFVMVSNALYNPASRSGREILRDIAASGCEIGLHFNPRAYRAKENLTARVADEAEILRLASGVEVRSVSIHEPSVFGHYPLFDGYINAYDPGIFNPHVYLSDSRMEFSQDPYEFIERSKDSTVQILLHPFHFTPNGEGYVEIFASGLAQRAELVDSTFSTNSTYVAARGENLLEVAAQLSRDRGETE